MGLTPVNAVTNTQLQAIVWGTSRKGKFQTISGLILDGVIV